MRYLYATNPKVAKEFADKTTSFKNLPEHAKQLQAIKKKLKKK